jgi:hypothetical protein
MMEGDKKRSEKDEVSYVSKFYRDERTLMTSTSQRPADTQAQAAADLLASIDELLNTLQSKFDKVSKEMYQKSKFVSNIFFSSSFCFASFAPNT